MKTKHTPGPWKVRRGVNEMFIDADKIVCLAVVNSLDETRKEVAKCKADARLISAAPKMLTALVSLIEAVGYLEADGEGSPIAIAIRKARSAIAKATT